MKVTNKDVSRSEWARALWRARALQFESESFALEKKDERRREERFFFIFSGGGRAESENV